MLSSPPPASQTTGAVSTLFREHHGELVRLALLMVGDLPTAEDVVQDVYASLHKRWSHSAAPDEVLPYVRAAVLNGCRSVLRRRGIARVFAVTHAPQFFKRQGFAVAARQSLSEKIERDCRTCAQQRTCKLVAVIATVIPERVVLPILSVSVAPAPAC